jgi:hypothetical protein
MNSIHSQSVYLFDLEHQKFNRFCNKAELLQQMNSCSSCVHLNDLSASLPLHRRIVTPAVTVLNPNKYNDSSGIFFAGITLHFELLTLEFPVHVNVIVLQSAKVGWIKSNRRTPSHLFRWSREGAIMFLSPPSVVSAYLGVKKEVATKEQQKEAEAAPEYFFTCRYN